MHLQQKKSYGTVSNSFKLSLEASQLNREKIGEKMCFPFLFFFWIVYRKTACVPGILQICILAIYAISHNTLYGIRALWDFILLNSFHYFKSVLFCQIPQNITYLVMIRVSCLPPLSSHFSPVNRFCATNTVSHQQSYNKCTHRMCSLWFQSCEIVELLC